jgi:hypothetical protein
MGSFLKCGFAIRSMDMKFFQAVWKGIRWFIDAFTDVNGYVCLTKVAGAALFLVGVYNLRLDLIGAGIVALGGGKALDAIVPKEPPISLK